MFSLVFVRLCISDSCLLYLLFRFCYLLSFLFSCTLGKPVKVRGPVSQAQTGGRVRSRAAEKEWASVTTFSQILLFSESFCSAHAWAECSEFGVLFAPTSAPSTCDSISGFKPGSLSTIMEGPHSHSLPCSKWTWLQRQRIPRHSGKSQCLEFYQPQWGLTHQRDSHTAMIIIKCEISSELLAQQDFMST